MHGCNALPSLFVLQHHCQPYVCSQARSIVLMSKSHAASLDPDLSVFHPLSGQEP